LLRQLQQGQALSMPHSRPMPTIGARCHELRIVDGGTTWRIVYRVDPDAVVIAEVSAKKTARRRQQSSALVEGD
jgi:phage-related protein